MRRIGCTGSDDYLGSGATSPLPLITRRYPIICILKPYDACPQVCVYCQRNWEIDDVLAPGAMAGHDELEAALRWIEQTTDYRCVLPTLCCPSHCPRHPAVRELAPRAAGSRAPPGRPSTRCATPRLPAPRPEMLG